MLHLQEKFVQRRTLTPEPLNASLDPLPMNLRGFVTREEVVTKAMLDGVDLSPLSVLAEQQRREGRMA